MAAAAFDDGKDPGALRTIGEVASGLNIKQHVLRYWEKQFPMLRPLQRSGNRRYYRPEDIELVETINRLVNREGYTLRGALQALEQGYAVEGNPAPAPVLLSSDETDEQTDVVASLKAIRNQLSAALNG